MADCIHLYATKVGKEGKWCVWCDQWASGTTLIVETQDLDTLMQGRWDEHALPFLSGGFLEMKGTMTKEEINSIIEETKHLPEREAQIEELLAEIQTLPAEEVTRALALGLQSMPDITFPRPLWERLYGWMVVKEGVRDFGESVAILMGDLKRIRYADDMEAKNKDLPDPHAHANPYCYVCHVNHY